MENTEFDTDQMRQQSMNIKNLSASKIIQKKKRTKNLCFGK